MPPIQLDHIAIALPRIADAPAVLVDVLGGVPERSRPAGGFRWASWTFADGSVIEILEPAGPDGFLHRFLAAHGRGVHHVTFKVPDLALVCRRAEIHGYDIVGRDESDPSWKEAFLHPKQALGIVVQLVESASAPPRDRPASLPTGLPDPPPPVSILGLRGEVGKTPAGNLLFRWPGSPLRPVVDVDATAPEGPTAIEIASEREVAPLDAASARLGIRLTRQQGGD